MNTTARYHILMDAVTGGVLIFDAETGRIQHPACWQDISAYYHYLLGRGRVDEAQRLLAESMAGSKPITRMVRAMSQTASESGYLPLGAPHAVAASDQQLQ